MMTVMGQQAKKLEHILNKHYETPQLFEEFCRELLDLGIIRFTYDAVSNEMSFYNHNALVWSTKRNDIEQSKNAESWIVGKYLDKDRVERAINAIDNANTDPVSFHRELFNAGVISVILYIVQRINYYLGVDGEVFIERY